LLMFDRLVHRFSKYFSFAFCVFNVQGLPGSEADLRIHVQWRHGYSGRQHILHVQVLTHFKIISPMFWILFDYSGFGSYISGRSGSGPKTSLKKTIRTSEHKELQHDLDSFSKLFDKRDYAVKEVFCKIA
jgi:hypothetical protein